MLINGYIEGVDAPFIRWATVAPMDLAVSHLVALGHKTIGACRRPGPLCPGHPQDHRLSQRVDDFARPGTDVEDLIWSTPMFSVEGGEGGSPAVDRQGTTAIVRLDLMALG